MSTPVLRQTFFNSDDTEQSSISVTLSDIQTGSYLVAVCCSAELSSSQVYMTMTGWSNKAVYASTSVPHTALFWKTAAGGETSASFSVAINNELSIIVFEITDTLGGASAWNVVKSGLQTSYITTPNIDGAITTLDNCLVLSIFNGLANASFSTAATGVLNHPPWTLVGESNAAGSSGDVRQVVSERDMDSSGDSSNITFSMGSTFIGRELSISFAGEAVESSTRRIFIS